MGKQRDAVRMSEREVQAFLDESKTLTVATLDSEGAPHLTALWFTRQGELLLFETYGASQKLVNLRRDPRIAVQCEAGAHYDELRGVSIQGVAEIVNSEPRLTELMTAIIARNMDGLDPQPLASHVAAMVRKRVVVVVHPRKVMSWDHRKLAKR